MSGVMSGVMSGANSRMTVDDPEQTLKCGITGMACALGCFAAGTVRIRAAGPK